MMSFIILWVVLSIGIGIVGYQREGKFLPAFISSMILSPLIGGVLTLLMKRKSGEETTLSKYRLYIVWGYAVFTLIAFTLPFHYVPSHLQIFPKDNLTLSHTFIFQSDIDELVKKFNDGSFSERLEMANSPLHKKLKEKGLIRSEESTNNNQYESEQLPTDTQTSTENNYTEQYSPDDQKIIDKIKAKSKRDFPDNYSTQKMIFEQAVQAYFYMKTVTDLKIKRNLERDYPLDYTVQKLLYDQEVDAKEQMK